MVWRRDQFRALRDAMPSSLPLILNGDVFDPAAVARAQAESGADSLMLSRGALWNPSIFRVGSGGSMAPQAEVVKRFIDLADETQCPMGNAKYTAMLMLEGSGKTPPFKQIQTSKTMADLLAGAAACAQHAHFTQPGGVFCPAVLEPPPDLPDALHEPINHWRPVPAFYTPGAKSMRFKAAKARAAAPAAPAALAPAAADASALVHRASAPAGAGEATDGLREVDATREDRYGPRPPAGAAEAEPAAIKRSREQMQASDGTGAHREC